MNDIDVDREVVRVRQESFEREDPSGQAFIWYLEATYADDQSRVRFTMRISMGDLTALNCTTDEPIAQISGALGDWLVSRRVRDGEDLRLLAEDHGAKVALRIEPS